MKFNCIIVSMRDIWHSTSVNFLWIRFQKKKNGASNVCFVFSKTFRLRQYSPETSLETQEIKTKKHRIKNIHVSLFFRHKLTSVNYSTIPISCQAIARGRFSLVRLVRRWRARGLWHRRCKGDFSGVGARHKEEHYARLIMQPRNGRSRRDGRSIVWSWCRSRWRDRGEIF